MQEISLNILDLAQNSITAGANLIEITVDEQPEKDTLEVVIKDNGCGMTEDIIKKVVDPFYTTRKTRKVGLGIPFFKMAAEMSGGRFEIHSRVGEGTSLCGVFGLSNIDRMPLGDIASTVISLIVCNPSIDFLYSRKIGKKQFVLDTRELRKVLGNVPLSNSEVSEWIKGYLSDGENEIHSDTNL